MLKTHGKEWNWRLELYEGREKDRQQRLNVGWQIFYVSLISCVTCISKNTGSTPTILYLMQHYMQKIQQKTNLKTKIHQSFLLYQEPLMIINYKVNYAWNNAEPRTAPQNLMILQWSLIPQQPAIIRKNNDNALMRKGSQFNFS